MARGRAIETATTETASDWVKWYQADGISRTSDPRLVGQLQQYGQWSKPYIVWMNKGRFLKI